MKLRILVKPNRKESSLSEPDEFERQKCDLVASLESRPEGGKANKELLGLLKDKYGKPARLVSGASSRLKLVEIA